MTATAEAVAARSAETILAAHSVGDDIAETEALADLLSALELVIPSVLRLTYPAEWRFESLDGFRLALAQKISATELELLGLCLLISDQTWTPFTARLRQSPDRSSISAISCQVGACDRSNEMTRLPHGSARESKLLSEVSERVGKIRWRFSAHRPHRLHDNE